MFKDKGSCLEERCKCLWIKSLALYFFVMKLTSALKTAWKRQEYKIVLWKLLEYINLSELIILKYVSNGLASWSFIPNGLKKKSKKNKRNWGCKFYLGRLKMVFNSPAPQCKCAGEPLSTFFSYGTNSDSEILNVSNSLRYTKSCLL